MNRFRTATLLLLFLASHALALESGTFLRDDVLRKKPKADAKVLASVGKGTKAEVLRVAGPWYLVRIDGKWEGWVPVNALRRHDSTAGAGAGALDSIGGVPGSMGAAGSLGGAPSNGGKSSNPR